MPSVAIDMIGYRSGRLLVVARAIGPKLKRAYWKCQCDCGTITVVMGKALRACEVKSCGCLHRQPMTGPNQLRLPPLVRNRNIVRAVDIMIAAPATDKEELRSGTWATVRYCRQARKPVIMLSRGV